MYVISELHDSRLQYSLQERGLVKRCLQYRQIESSKSIFGQVIVASNRAGYLAVFDDSQSSTNSCHSVRFLSEVQYWQNLWSSASYTTVAAGKHHKRSQIKGQWCHHTHHKQWLGNCFCKSSLQTAVRFKTMQAPTAVVVSRQSTVVLLLSEHSSQ